MRTAARTGSAAGRRAPGTATSAAAPASAAPMSASCAETKLAAANWTTAKAHPQARAGAQVSRSPRRPSTRKTSSSGTTRASSGVWRPTTEATASSGRPVTWARVTTGVPMAPKATGAVLATSATTAALTGSKPSATSITALMATGAPKPASASRSAPKQKAMTRAWMRGSAESREKERRSTSKWWVRTVIRYTHRALTTIHRMGKSPKTAPWAAPASAWPVGMPYPHQATARATARPVRPA